MYVGRDFDALDVGETDVFTLDFVNDLVAGEAIYTASFSIQVLSGTDASAASRLSGSAVVVGSQVSQAVTGTLDGVQYRLVATAITSNGRTLRLWSNVWSRNPLSAAT